MRKTILTLGVLCLGLALSTGALAAASGQADHKNPVVDLTDLVNPGLWQTTAVTMVKHGKPEQSLPRSKCFTLSELHDYLNQGDWKDSRVEKYSLQGNHLHIEAASMKASPEQLQVSVDTYFDSRDHMHSTGNVAETLWGHTVNMKVKLNSHRMGVCPKGSDDR